MIVSKLTHHAPYGFEQAFEFLHKANDLPVGKYPIDGERMFALVQENTPKALEETQFEAHQSYVDIQYILSGAERMDVAPLEDMTPKAPYDPQKDVVFLQGEARAALILKEGEFAVFFPEDAHRPGIALSAEQALVRKVVVKIRWENALADNIDTFR